MVEIATGPSCGPSLQGLDIGEVPGEQHDVLAVVLERLGLTRLDHDRAVDARLLLEIRVRVVPIGTALARVKPIRERLAGSDAAEAHARRACSRA